jgi:rod shape-determining protein MreD
LTTLSQALAVWTAVFLMLAIESPMLQHLHLAYFAPDLALIAVVWIAIRMSVEGGALLCFALGYLKDGFVMAVPIGMHMEIFVLLFFVVRYFSSKLLVRGLLTLILTVAVTSLLASGLFAVLSLLFDPTFTDYRLVMRLAGPVALVTAPFAPVVFFLLDRVDGLFVRKQATLFQR